MPNPEPKPVLISWYRTPLDPKAFKSLHQRSDVKGFAQTLGYLGLLVLTGGSVLCAAGHAPAWVVLLLLFLHGTFCNFLINAVHELGHNTVFRTRALNAFFVPIFAFFGWINHFIFEKSHSRHHRYTLHQPDDGEVVLPLKVLMRDFFLYGFINPKRVYEILRGTPHLPLGKFNNPWERSLFPEGDPERHIPIRWARILLIGHGSIIALSIYFHLWLLPVVTTFCTCYGSWLHRLCNDTQHIGLQDDVPDFRLCCRTFTLNPFVQFLYWHMNFHIEHHMYAAVPCYHLGRLHRLIQYDLPPCPKGLVATWLEIARIQRIQETDPHYQYVAPLPRPVSEDSPATGIPLAS
jgi:fatty acid desaturase